DLLHGEEIRERYVLIDPMRHPSVDRLILVATGLFAEQQPKSLSSILRGKCKRQRLARRLRCRPWLHVRFERSSRPRFVIGNIEQLIGTGGTRETCYLAAEVVRQVVAFEGRKTELEADVNEESGCNEREEERAERV